jgi:hypothetical protein
MNMKPKELTFWITNISKTNINLSDLNVNIKAHSSANLLDKRHYSFTLEQLQKSASTGSLAVKKSAIIICQGSPITKNKNIIINKESVIPTRQRSILNIKEEYFAELDLTNDDQKKRDEEFAASQVELEYPETVVKTNKKEHP